MKDGQRCEKVFGVVTVTASGAPPDAWTRKIAPLLAGATMITPLLFHAPPRAVGALQIVCAGPSGKVFFFNLPSANQAMERPSPDQNGYSPPSVPSSSSGASASSSRSHRYVRPSGVVA